MECQKKRQSQRVAAKRAVEAAAEMKRKALKRKQEFDLDEGDLVVRHVVTKLSSSRRIQAAVRRPIEEQIEKLNSIPAGARSEPERSAAKCAAAYLAQVAKNEVCLDVPVGNGAIPVLVKHLQLPEIAKGVDAGVIPYQYEVERECARALSRLAFNEKNQKKIVDEGAVPLLVNLLKLKTKEPSSEVLNGVIKRAANAITNLAHENNNIKSLVRIEGAIPLLVELLKSDDLKAHVAVADALRTLSYRNEENKVQIVRCDALDTLVLMLSSEDPAIHSDAIGIIGNLVHSSPNIKKLVLEAGALQPVIQLLSSGDLETQREAALLIGQFAAADSDTKANIVQRGAALPLIKMLRASDAELKQMASFALGRLAQETHNKAGIGHYGGILPLLKLLESKNTSLQHNAAFALYGLVGSEDNVPDFVKFGGVTKLLETEFSVQQTKDCVDAMLKILEEKMCGRVLKKLMYLMKVSETNVRASIAFGLARICSPADLKAIFIANNGLNTLLDLLVHGSVKEQQLSSKALHMLYTKAASLSGSEVSSDSSSPEVIFSEQYVNNDKCSDVTFLVEGKPFYAHRECLLASSDAFRAMFNGGYREKDIKDVEIPNVSWDVFEQMMRYVYTGHVEVNLSIAQDLLIVADQYLLEGLKRLCESAIGKAICVNNLQLMYELSETFNAKTLKKECILFILSKFSDLSSRPWFSTMLEQCMPDLRYYFNEVLNGPDKH